MKKREEWSWKLNKTWTILVKWHSLSLETLTFNNLQCWSVSPLTFRKNPIRIISFELFYSQNFYYRIWQSKRTLSHTAINLAKVLGCAYSNMGAFRETLPWTYRRLLAHSALEDSLPLSWTPLKKSWWRLWNIFNCLFIPTMDSVFNFINAICT